MDITEVIKQVRSGVCKIEFCKGEIIVNSGSAFIYKNKLITNSHVFHPEGITFSDDTEVVLIFGDGSKKQLTIGQLNLIIGSGEENADYAVYDLEDLIELKDKYNFELRDLQGINEGDEVLILGFPFETTFLTTHYGRISALFEQGGIKKVQIDASVNQGNSGGPLYHIKSGKVIGIITRKQSGLTKDFDNLLLSFSNNIDALKNAQKNGSINMFGVNPIKVFEISQTQMKLISQNISRSANTGIGYAFSCENLINENI